MRKLLYLVIFFLLVFRVLYPVFASEQAGIEKNCVQPKSSSQNLYVMLIDESGSMGDKGIETLNKSFDALDKTLLNGSQIMVRKFSDLLVGDQFYTTYNKTSLRQVIDNTINFGKISRLYDSLYISQKNIRTLADRNSLHPFIILFSDGINQNSIVDYAAVKKVIGEYRVPLIIFAIDGKKKANDPLLKELAELSCGIFIKPELNSPTYTQDLVTRLSTQTSSTKGRGETKDSLSISGIKSSISSFFSETDTSEESEQKTATDSTKNTGIIKSTDKTDTSQNKITKNKPAKSAPASGIVKEKSQKPPALKEQTDKSDSKSQSDSQWEWILLLLFLILLLILIIWFVLRRRKKSPEEVHEIKEDSIIDDAPINEQTLEETDSESIEPEHYSKDDLFDDLNSEELKNNVDQKVTSRSELIEKAKKKLMDKRRPTEGDPSDYSDRKVEMGQFVQPKIESVFDTDNLLSPNKMKDEYRGIVSIIGGICENRMPEMNNMVVLEYIASGAMNPDSFTRAVSKKKALGFIKNFPKIMENFDEDKRKTAIQALNMIIASCGFEYDGILGDQNWKNFCDVNAKSLPDIEVDHGHIQALAEQTLKSHLLKPVPVTLTDNVKTYDETIGAGLYNKLVFFSELNYPLMKKIYIHSEKENIHYEAIVEQVQYYKALGLFRSELKLLSPM